MNEYQLRKLNNRRIKISKQYNFLIHRRDHVLEQLGLIDEKLETLENLNEVIDIQLNQEILDGNLELIVHHINNPKDQLVPMVEIKIKNHPSIFKIFDDLEYFLYTPTKVNNIPNAVYINHLKKLALEWLKKQNSYLGYFDNICLENKKIDSEFIENIDIDNSLTNNYLL